MTTLDPISRQIYESLQTRMALQVELVRPDYAYSARHAAECWTAQVQTDYFPDEMFRPMLVSFFLVHGMDLAQADTAADRIMPWWSAQWDGAYFTGGQS